MSNNINRIIELQQTDQNKVENGYYKPSLNYGNEITLEEGDELSLHSVFVDTVAIENSQIELDEDVNVSMKFYLYNRFNRTDNIVKVPIEKLVILHGLNGFIVVENKGDLLICKRDDEQDIKNIVAQLKNRII